MAKKKSKHTELFNLSDPLLSSGLAYPKPPAMRWDEGKLPPKHYTPQQLMEELDNIIEQYNVLNLDDLYYLAPVTKDEACMVMAEYPEYENYLIRKIGRNNTHIKGTLTSFWMSPLAPSTLQIAAYRLRATEDERRRLCTSYRNDELKVGELLTASVNIEAVTPEGAPPIATSEKDVDA